MAQFNFKNISIAGLASAIPENKIKIAECNKLFSEKTINSIIEQSGLIELRKSISLQTASDLGFKAAESLIISKLINTEDIGFILFISKTPDYRSPATATVLHHRLNLSKNCAAFDVNQGSMGFLYALQIGASLLDSISQEYGIIVIGDTSSKQHLPINHANLTSSDAASAILLQKNSTQNSMRIQIKTQSDKLNIIEHPSGGYRHSNNEDIEDSLRRNLSSVNDLRVNQNELNMFANIELPNLISKYLKKNEYSFKDFDLLAIYHEYNDVIYIILEKLKLSKEFAQNCFSNFGNTYGCSTPVLLAQKYNGQRGKDVRILASSFGEGLSWGIADFIINTNAIFPIIETDDYFKDGEVGHNM